MTEHVSHGPERMRNPNKVEHQHSPETSPSKRAEKREAEQAPDVKESLDSIRSHVTQEAVSGKDVVIDTSSEQNNGSSDQPLVYSELRKDMLDRTLVHIRKKLPVASRQLSKVVHAKPVEFVSEVGEKTVARPVGLLGGGLSALVGSGFALYMARHYGYRYNFLLFVLLFVAGYALSTIVEMIFMAVHRLRHGKSISK